MTSTRDQYSRIEYRRLIAWPERIEREAPLLEEILGSGPSRRLLDLGCGTGEHARYLASRDFTVVGVDASESMLAAAQDQVLPANLTFIAGDIRQVDQVVEGEFGGAVCLGNTLPHIREDAGLRGLFTGLRRRLLPEAPLLIQILNYQRIFHRRERHLPLNFRSDGDEEIVFLRLMELGEDGEITFYPSTLRLVPGGEPPLEVKAAKEVKLRGWLAAEIEEALEETGFERRRMLGDFAGNPFEPLASRDLILVAR